MVPGQRATEADLHRHGDPSRYGLQPPVGDPRRCVPGSVPAGGRAVSEYKPFQIELHGQSVELTDAEAKAILKSLHQQSSERRRAEEDQARAAGQVWYAVYW